jgi:hypothetical protein
MRMPERNNLLIEKIAMRAAWALPRRVVKWAAIRLVAEVTSTGKYYGVEVPAIRAMDAIGAWKSG